MMGTTNRQFSPLPGLSLEELVPDDHPYRRLEAEIELSFVRELVGPLYAGGGRPSVDPVVFFKLQLVMSFEGLRSERELMRVAADRLSVRWYLGYDLFEALPDHSDLTRARERFGPSFYRRSMQHSSRQSVPSPTPPPSENGARRVDGVSRSLRPVGRSVLRFRFASTPGA